MVKAVLKMLGREISGLHEAAYLLGFFAFLSQILALVRDRIFAHQFGAGAALDIYYGAFRIPDLIFISVASLVSVSVLVPFVIGKLASSHDAAKKFIDGVFSFFFLLMIVVSVGAFFLMPILAPVIFSGFSSASLDLVIVISRILLLSPIFLGISNFFGSITQAKKRFFVYAISPLLYNIGIIIGAIAFYPIWGLPGLAYGVILGAFLHMAIQVPAVFADGLFPKFRFRVDWATAKEVCRISVPRTVTLGLSQLVIILFISLASEMPEGSISIFNFSWNLQSVPLSIIGVSYSLAAFPALSRLFAEGKRSLFVGHIIEATRHIIFWSFPITILFIVLRAQIVRVILGSGEFSWSDTRLTAAALALFAVSALAQGLVLLFVRGYYAEGKTKIPLVINLGTSILAVVLVYVFAWLFRVVPVTGYFLESLLRVSDLSGTAILALPLAYSIAIILNAVLLWKKFDRDILLYSKPLLNTMFQSFSASIIMGFATYFFLNLGGLVFDLNTFFGIFLQGLFAGILGIIVLILVLKLLKSPELEETWSALHKKIWRAKAVAPEPSEL